MFIRISCMRARRLSLGTRPPSVTGVKLYRAGPQGICTEAQLDLDFLWGGNQAGHRGSPCTCVHTQQQPLLGSWLY